MGTSALSVAVLGASGYAGAEALRLLSVHPRAEVTVLGAGTAAGKAVDALYPHLHPYAGRVFEDPGPDEVAARADAALLALPHGESASLAPALVEAGVRVVDLSGAFRLTAGDYPSWYGFEHPAPAWLDKAAYGLPELFGETIPGAQLVANPGCYPTAALLALVPLLRAGVIEPDGIVIDAKSGLSGAGRHPSQATHFAASDGSVRPYKPGRVHQHVPEIERHAGATVTFVPHLVPATRGLLATCYARLRGGDPGHVLTEAYEGRPFVRVLPEGALPDTKRVTGSNMVEVAATTDGSTAVVMAALDNLVKGGAGQAVQNLNLMHGFPETMGLDHPAVYP